MIQVKVNVDYQYLQHSLCKVNICILTSFQKRKIVREWRGAFKVNVSEEKHSHAQTSLGL